MSVGHRSRDDDNRGVSPEYYPDANMADCTTNIGCAESDGANKKESTNYKAFAGHSLQESFKSSAATDLVAKSRKKLLRPVSGKGLETDNSESEMSPVVHPDSSQRRIGFISSNNGTNVDPVCSDEREKSASLDNDFLSSAFSDISEDEYIIDEENEYVKSYLSGAENAELNRTRAPGETYAPCSNPAMRPDFRYNDYFIGGTRSGSVLNVNKQKFRERLSADNAEAYRSGKSVGGSLRSLKESDPMQPDKTKEPYLNDPRKSFPREPFPREAFPREIFQREKIDYRRSSYENKYGYPMRDPNIAYTRFSRNEDMHEKPREWRRHRSYELDLKNKGEVSYPMTRRSTMMSGGRIERNEEEEEEEEEDEEEEAENESGIDRLNDYELAAFIKENLSAFPHLSKLNSDQLRRVARSSYPVEEPGFEVNTGAEAYQGYAIEKPYSNQDLSRKNISGRKGNNDTSYRSPVFSDDSESSMNAEMTEPMPGPGMRLSSAQAESEGNWSIPESHIHEQFTVLDCRDPRYPMPNISDNSYSVIDPRSQNWPPMPHMGPIESQIPPRFLNERGPFDPRIWGQSVYGENPYSSRPYFTGQSSSRFPTFDSSPYDASSSVRRRYGTTGGVTKYPSSSLGRNPNNFAEPKSYGEYKQLKRQEMELANRFRLFHRELCSSAVEPNIPEEEFPESTNKLPVSYVSPRPLEDHEKVKDSSKLLPSTSVSDFKDKLRVSKTLPSSSNSESSRSVESDRGIRTEKFNGNKVSYAGDELISPLEKLYDSPRPVTGRGYGLQNFRIPKKSVQTKTDKKRSEFDDKHLKIKQCSASHDIIDLVSDDSDVSVKDEDVCISVKSDQSVSGLPDLKKTPEVHRTAKKVAREDDAEKSNLNNRKSFAGGSELWSGRFGVLQREKQKDNNIIELSIGELEDAESNSLKLNKNYLCQQEEEPEAGSTSPQLRKSQVSDSSTDNCFENTKIDKHVKFNTSEGKELDQRVDLDTSMVPQLSDELSQEIFQVLMKQTLRHGERVLCLQQDQFLKDFALKVDSKKWKCIRKIINSESDSSSTTSDSSRLSEKKKRKSKKSKHSDVNPDKWLKKSKKSKKKSYRKRDHPDASGEKKKKKSKKPKPLPEKIDSPVSNSEPEEDEKSEEVSSTKDFKTSKGKIKLLNQIFNRSPSKNLKQGGTTSATGITTDANASTSASDTTNTSVTSATDITSPGSPEKESEQKPKSRTKGKSKTELEKLHDDLKHVFVASDISSVSPRRMCRVMRESGGKTYDSDLVPESAKTQEKPATRRSGKNAGRSKTKDTSSDQRAPKDNSNFRDGSEVEDVDCPDFEVSENMKVYDSEMMAIINDQPSVVLHRIDLKEFSYAYKINGFDEGYKRQRGLNVARRGRGNRSSTRRGGGESDTFLTSEGGVYLRRNMIKPADVETSSGKNPCNTKGLKEVVQGLAQQMEGIGLGDNDKKQRVTQRGPRNSAEARNEPIFNGNGILDYAFERHKSVFSCLLCKIRTKDITYHYMTQHPESEVLISRLSLAEAKEAICESRARNYEETTVDQSRAIDAMIERMQSKASQRSFYKCRMCNGDKIPTISQFFTHVSTHTGEYRFRCPIEECRMYFINRGGLKSHMSARHPAIAHQAETTLELFPLPSDGGVLFGYLCSRCNFVQLLRRNAENHIVTEHSNSSEVKIIKIDMSENVEGVIWNLEGMTSTERAAIGMSNVPSGSGINIGASSNQSKDDRSINRMFNTGFTYAVPSCSREATGESSNGPSQEFSRYNKENLPSAIQCSTVEVTNRTAQGSREGEGPNSVDCSFVHTERTKTVESYSQDVSVQTGSSHDGYCADVIKIDKLKKIEAQDSTSKTNEVRIVEKKLMEIGVLKNQTSENGAIIKTDDGSDSTVEKIWEVGPIKAEMFKSGILSYKCAVSGCQFSTKVFTYLEDHITSGHRIEKWNGVCKTCIDNPELKVEGLCGTVGIDKILEHMECHIKMEARKHAIKIIKAESIIISKNQLLERGEPNEIESVNFGGNFDNVSQSLRSNLHTNINARDDKLSQKSDHLNDARTQTESQSTVIKALGNEKEKSNLFTIRDVRSLKRNAWTETMNDQNICQDVTTQNLTKSKCASDQPVVVPSCPPKITLVPETNTITIPISPGKQVLNIGPLSVVPSATDVAPIGLQQFALFQIPGLRLVSPSVFNSKAVPAPTFSNSPCMLTLSNPVNTGVKVTQNNLSTMMPVIHNPPLISNVLRGDMTVSLANNGTNAVEQIQPKLQIWNNIPKIQPQVQVSNDIEKIQPSLQIWNNIPKIQPQVQVSNDVEKIQPKPHIWNNVPIIQPEVPISNDVERIQPKAQISNDVDKIQSKAQISNDVDKIQPKAQISNDVDKIQPKPEISNDVERIQPKAQISNDVGKTQLKAQKSNGAKKIQPKAYRSNDAKKIQRKAQISNDAGKKAQKVQIPNDVGKIQPNVQILNDAEKTEPKVEISPKGPIGSSPSTPNKLRQFPFPYEIKNSKSEKSYSEMLTKKKLCELFKCMAAECSFTTNSDAVFTRHVIVHESYKRLKGRKRSESKIKKSLNWQKCAYCSGAVINGASDLSKHILAEHGHCLYQCSLCFYRGVSELYVDHHQNIVHGNVLTDQKRVIYVCKPLPGADLGKRVQGCLNINYVKPYRCQICGKIYFILKHFYNHLMKHHSSVTAYTCHICKILCFKAERLIAHYRIHSYSLYQCPYCLHGGENKKEMIFHLCNLHFSQLPILFVRILNETKKGGQITVHDLKLVRLQDDPISGDYTLEEAEEENRKQQCDIEKKAAESKPDSKSPPAPSPPPAPPPSPPRISIDLSAIVSELGIDVEDGSQESFASLENVMMEMEKDFSKDVPVESILPNATFSSDADNVCDENSAVIVNTECQSGSPGNQKEVLVPIGEIPMNVPMAENKEQCSATEIEEIQYNSGVPVGVQDGAENPKNFVTFANMPVVKNLRICELPLRGMHKLPPTIPINRCGVTNVYQSAKDLTKKLDNNQGQVKHGVSVLKEHFTLNPNDSLYSGSAQIGHPAKADALTSETEGSGIKRVLPIAGVKRPATDSQVQHTLIHEGENNPPKKLCSSAVAAPAPRTLDTSRESPITISGSRSLLEERTTLQPPIIRVEDFASDENGHLVRISETSIETRKNTEDSDKSEVYTQENSNSCPEFAAINRENGAKKLLEEDLDSQNSKQLDSTGEAEGCRTVSIINDNNEADGEDTRLVTANDKETNPNLVIPVDNEIGSLELEESNAEKYSLVCVERLEDSEECASADGENSPLCIDESESAIAEITGINNENSGGNEVDQIGKVLIVVHETTKIAQTDSKKSELTGRSLYMCGATACLHSSETAKELKNHILECEFFKEVPSLKCPHCSKNFKHYDTFVRHLRVHGENVYNCGLCDFSAPLERNIIRHLKVKHKCHHTKTLPNDSFKNDHFIVYPKTYKVERRNAVLHVFSPGEEDKLPLQSVYQDNVKCARCPYFTKVRSNMVRHLKQHAKSEAAEGSIVVPSTAPTNPVPCLTSNEKMFDKMANLAASSQLAFANKDKLEALTPEMIAKLPQLVPEQMRHKCCSQECNYVTVDDNMLKHHIKALHDEINVYSCPHCSESVNIEFRFVPLDKIGQHLKYHDTKLYKCCHCMYFHHQKYLVGKHLIEKHTEKRFFIHVVREPPPDPPPPEVPPVETIVKMWKCGFCDDFERRARSLVIEHVHAAHNTKAKYKCKHCDMKSSQSSAFQSHFNSKHNGEKVEYLKAAVQISRKCIGVSEDAGEDASDEYFDTTPLWQRHSSGVRHIRGILIEEEEMKARKVKRNDYDIMDRDVPAFQDCFFCPLCTNPKKTFKTKKSTELRMHMYQELKNYLYACTLCGKMFVELKEYENHHNKQHPSAAKSVKHSLGDPKIKIWTDNVIKMQRSRLKNKDESDNVDEQPSTSSSSTLKAKSKAKAKGKAKAKAKTTAKKKLGINKKSDDKAAKNDDDKEEEENANNNNDQNSKNQNKTQTKTNNNSSSNSKNNSRNKKKKKKKESSLKGYEIKENFEEGDPDLLVRLNYNATGIPKISVDNVEIFSDASDLPDSDGLDEPEEPSMPVLIPADTPADMPVNTPADMPTIMPTITPADMPVNTPVDMPTIMSTVTPEGIQEQMQKDKQTEKQKQEQELNKRHEEKEKQKPKHKKKPEPVEKREEKEKQKEREKKEQNKKEGKEKEKKEQNKKEGKEKEKEKEEKEKEKERKESKKDQEHKKKEKEKKAVKQDQEHKKGDMEKEKERKDPKRDQEHKKEKEREGGKERKVPKRDQEHQKKEREKEKEKKDLKQNQKQPQDKEQEHRKKHKKESEREKEPKENQNKREREQEQTQARANAHAQVQVLAQAQGGRWLCQFCKETFPTENDVEKHCKNNHADTPAKVLFVPEKKTGEEKDYLSSFKNNDDQGNAKESGRPSRNDSGEKTGKNLYTCGYCSMQETDPTSMLNHFETYHKKGDSTSGPNMMSTVYYRCNVCSKKLFTINSLNVHAEEYHPNTTLHFEIRRIYKYDTAAKEVKTAKSLTEKAREADVARSAIEKAKDVDAAKLPRDKAKEGSYQCPRCPMISISYLHCIDHFNEHYPRYTCGDCGDRFYSVEDVESHQKENSHSTRYAMTIPSEKMLEEYKAGITVKHNGVWVSLQGLRKTQAADEGPEIKRQKTLTARKSTTQIPERRSHPDESSASRGRSTSLR